MGNKKHKLYIANDVETSGPRLGIHTMLSWGACVVTPDELSCAERLHRGLTFYVEIQPTSSKFTVEAMRVGCKGLRCLHPYKDDPRYNPEAPEFNPALVLKVLHDSGIPPGIAVTQFINWLASLGNDREIVPVTDTVFFDSGFIQFLIAGAGMDSSPYGHAGIDLDSLCRGYTRDMGATLHRLGLRDTRKIAHCALDDAMFLADLARELIYVRLDAK